MQQCVHLTGTPPSVFAFEDLLQNVRKTNSKGVLLSEVSVYATLCPQPINNVYPEDILRVICSFRGVKSQTKLEGGQVAVRLIRIFVQQKCYQLKLKGP